MFDYEFRLSPDDLAEGEKLSMALSTDQRDLVDNWHEAASSQASYSGSGVLYAAEPGARNFTRSLEHLAAEVPLYDVATDIQDFGLIVATAREFDLSIPSIQIGQGGPVVPILPAERNSLINETPTSGDEGSDLFHRLMDFGDKPVEVTTQSIESAQYTFFTGLGSFLAARIAGVRWAAKTGRDFLSGGGSGGGGGGGSPGSPPIAMQKWSVTTQGGGLALYYSGTHASRAGASYLNAPTTPVDVYLPMGTLFLAADAGPGGAYVWDNKKITVPSHTPNYITKRF